MIPVSRRFGWHRWPKWTQRREGRFLTQIVTKESDLAKATAEALERGLGKSFVEQQRECEGCGRLELRTEYA